MPEQTPPYNDGDLVTHFAQGDQRAFTQLVEVYASQVYAHVLRYIKSAVRAEEITQDIFLKIWQSREDVGKATNISAYLYTLTRNHTISALRKKLQQQDAELEDEMENAALNPVEQLEYKELSDTLLRGVELLPPRRQQIFRMSRFNGMTYEQISQELNISKGTVNEHIVEALVFLRSYLRNHVGNGIALSILFSTMLSN